jgi:hypothetical protein
VSPGHQEIFQRYVLAAAITRDAVAELFTEGGVLVARADLPRARREDRHAPDYFAL